MYYKLVSAKTPEKLEEAVVKLLKSGLGWNLLGVPFAGPNGDYCQGMLNLNAML